MPVEKLYRNFSWYRIFHSRNFSFCLSSICQEKNFSEYRSVPDEIEMEEIDESRTSSYIQSIENSTSDAEDDNLDTRIANVRENLTALITERNENKINKLHENAYHIDEKSDNLCSWLQIFTSCFLLLLTVQTM